MATATTTGVIAEATSFPPGTGLTTNKAPYIEQARSHGDVFITQPYEL